MERLRKYGNIIGIAGVYIYAVSLITSKGVLNIGLALMTLGALFLIKDFRWDKIEIELKIFLGILISIPIFDMLSPGGFASAKVTLKQSYRFLPLFMMPIFLNTMERVKKFMGLITISVLINCIYGLALYRKKNWNFNIRYESITTIMDSAHALVGLSFVVLAMAIILFKERKRLLGFLTLGIYMLNIGCVLLGQTRGAWLGFIAGIFLFILLSFNKKIIIGFMIISSIGIFGVKSGKLEDNRYYNRFTTINNLDDSSNKIRLLMWEASLEIYKKHPVFGVGKDNSPKYFLEYFEKNDSYSKVENWSVPMMKSVATSGNPHNMYFDNLVNMGALFFVLLSYWMWIFARVSLMVVKGKKDDEGHWIVLTSCTMILVYYITGLTEGAWGEFIKRHIYVTAVVLYLSLKKILREKKE